MEAWGGGRGGAAGFKVAITLPGMSSLGFPSPYIYIPKEIIDLKWVATDPSSPSPVFRYYECSVVGRLLALKMWLRLPGCLLRVFAF